mgnify:CR=1 FL=1
MMFFEILENIGICFGIYLGVIFFPWIFTIFVKQKPELSNNEPLKEGIVLKPKKYSYHIDLSTKLIINFQDFEKIKIASTESEPSVIEETKQVSEMLDLANIRELYTKKEFTEVINATKKRLEIYPEEAETKTYLLRSYFLNKEYNECIQISKEVLEMDESDIEALRFIARSKMNIGKQDERVL